MTARLLLRACAVAATGLVLSLSVIDSPTAASNPTPASAAAHDRPAEAAPYDAPLTVTIEEMTPGVLPRKGPMVIRGRVTNVDLESWREISLFPMFGAGGSCTTCGEVLTSPSDLATAAATDPDLPVGDREPAVNDTVAELAPGESREYTLRIPQKTLRAAFGDATPGVYWFGVHALGSSDTTPSDKVADGRARTFLPVVPRRYTDPNRTGTLVDTAIVVPLRAQVSHAADGRLTDLTGWQTGLGPDGHLGGPLAFGAASSGTPFSWLVDPAIPDAVQHLVRGNRPRNITAVPAPTETEEPEASSSPTEDDDTSAPTIPDALVTAARTWLNRAQTELTGHEVLGLPYGDPDLDAAALTLPDLYTTARTHRAPVLDGWEVDPTDVATSPDGYLEPGAISAIDDGATLLLDRGTFPEETYGDEPPTDGLVDDRPIVVTSRAAARGGPGPDPRRAPVALRQRILSEAAVRLLGAGKGDPAPLVVVLPSAISAAGAAEFWQGLDQDWLHLVEVSDLAPSVNGSTSDQQVNPTTLTAPARRQSLSTSVLVEAGQLLTAAGSLQAILGDEYAVGDELIAEALTGASYSTRDDTLATERLSRTRDWVAEQLAAITVDAPAGVSLSGSSGGFNVSVRNGLDHPVTVHLEATTDDGAKMEVANPIRLGARSRSSVPVHADVTRSGVHNLTLRVTDPEGRPLGGVDTVPVRSGQSSAVIWLIIAVGAGILFVAIGIRLVRRIRRGSAATTTDDEENNETADGATGEATDEAPA